MIVYNDVKAVFKKRLQYWQEAYADAEVVSFEIAQDILASSTSSVEVIEVPNAVSVGDVIILMNYDGTKIWNGTVSQIEGNKISCDDIYELLNYNVLFRKSPATYTGKMANKLYRYILQAKNQCIYKVLENGVETQVTDKLLYRFFTNIQYFSDDSTDEYAMKFDDNTVLNIREEMFKINNLGYTVLMDVNPMAYDWQTGTNYASTIRCRAFRKTNLKIDDTSLNTLSTNIVEEKAEYNKLQIFDETNMDRQVTNYYLTPSGITRNPEALDRDSVTKNKIVWKNGDTTYEQCRAENLAPFLYNHKIEMEILYNGSYLNFENYELGDEVQAFVQGKTYSTVFTGYTMQYKKGEGLQTVKMIFGKVRNRATQKWFQ